MTVFRNGVFADRISYVTMKLYWIRWTLHLTSVVPARRPCDDTGTHGKEGQVTVEAEEGVMLWQGLRAASKAGGGGEDVARAQQGRLRFSSCVG